LKGAHEFHEAVAFYYQKAHHVSLHPETEIMCVIGSRDGLVHLPMAFMDLGDIILVPDPGYPAYATGIARPKPFRILCRFEKKTISRQLLRAVEKLKQSGIFSEK
jgi:aspartate/methionine/tyrosine aminotransferase